MDWLKRILNHLKLIQKMKKDKKKTWNPKKQRYLTLLNQWEGRMRLKVSPLMKKNDAMNFEKMTLQMARNLNF